MTPQTKIEYVIQSSLYNMEAQLWLPTTSEHTIVSVGASRDIFSPCIKCNKYVLGVLWLTNNPTDNHCQLICTNCVPGELVKIPVFYSLLLGCIKLDNWQLIKYECACCRRGRAMFTITIGQFTAYLCTYCYQRMGSLSLWAYKLLRDGLDYNLLPELRSIILTLTVQIDTPLPYRQ